MGPGNVGLEISDNDLEKGEAPIINGIAFTTFFGTTSPSTMMNVRNNKIKRFPDYGIVAEELSGTGMLGEVLFHGGVYPSWIVGNEVYDNGMDGIFIDGASVAYNTNISLFDNEVKGNDVFDCHDTSTTGNTWFNNIGNLNYPTGLCTPSRNIKFEPLPVR
jgi:hypothetical protein